MVQGEAAEAEVCSSPVPCVLVPDLPILGNMTPAASLQPHCSLHPAAGDLWTGISSILVPPPQPPPSGLTSHQTEAGLCEYDCAGWPHQQCQVTCRHVSGHLEVTCVWFR